MLAIFACLQFCQSYFHPPVYDSSSSSASICTQFSLNPSPSPIFLLSLFFSLLSLHWWFQIVSLRSAAQMGSSAPARWKKKKRWNPVKLWTASGRSEHHLNPRWPSTVHLCHSAHPKPWPPWILVLIRPQGIARPPTACLWWGECWRQA